MDDFHDELMEKAVDLMAQAASLLGWNIAIHECGKNKEFINGIVVGHPKYIGSAIDAFDSAEAAEEKKNK